MMRHFFAKNTRVAFAGSAAAVALVALPQSALANTSDDQLTQDMLDIFIESGVVSWKVGLITMAGIACAGLTKQAAGCAAGALTIAGIGLAVADENIPDNQGERLLTDPNLPTQFSGVAVDSEGSVQYAGTRTGALLQGGYSGAEGSGTFVGAIQRNGSVSGNYVEGAERGVFSGSITPNLDQVFGAGQCTQNCD